MQKHNQLLITICTSIVIWQSSASAGIYYLPRYQGENIERIQTGGRENVKISCEARGGVEKKENQICKGAFFVGNKICYKSCTCDEGYKISENKCVEKNCYDYNASYLMEKDDTQSCVEISPRKGLVCYECTPCDIYTYKYTCTGEGYEQTQSGNICNSLYASCNCVSGYTWNGTECKADLPPKDTSEVYTKVISAGSCYDDISGSYGNKHLWGRDLTVELYCHDNGNVSFWTTCFQRHEAYYRYSDTEEQCYSCPYTQIGNYRGTGWNCTAEYIDYWCD